MERSKTSLPRYWEIVATWRWCSKIWQRSEPTRPSSATSTNCAGADPPTSSPPLRRPSETLASLRDAKPPFWPPRRAQRRIANISLARELTAPIPDDHLRDRAPLPRGPEWHRAPRPRSGWHADREQHERQHGNRARCGDRTSAGDAAYGRRAA